MKLAFFGQYLLNRGLINAVQLARAVQLQRDVNLEMGGLAQDSGLLTREQVKKILELQKREDIYFGEAAVRLSFLTQRQVDDLTKEQEIRHINLGDALIRLGFLTEQVRNRTLEDFIKDQEEYARISEDIYPKELRGERFFIEEFISSTIKILQRIGGIIVKYSHCEMKSKDIEIAPVSIGMNFIGSFSRRVSRYIILISRETAYKIAAEIYKRAGLDTDKILVGDVISELVNVICGQTCSKLSEIEELRTNVIEIFKENCILGSNEKAALVSLLAPFGQVNFIIVFRLSI